MSSDPVAKHLLTVWNPSYAADAMDEHLRVLLDWAERARRGRAQDEDVYVWWGKVRSPNRRQPLPHTGDILALQGQIEEGRETHLYLTDYRSLYVGLLEDIAGESLLAEYPDEADHMPGYYRGLMLDFWFKLADVRRLVANDTPATIEELKRLRNTRYFDRPVSLYGGITELPLIVTRDGDAGVGWFSDRAALTDGRLWAERDAALRGETERLAQDLRDNLIGRSVWALLEPASTAFLASAEAVFRSHRDDPGFDFSACAVEYAKAVEAELNAVVFRPLRRRLAHAASSDRIAHSDEQPCDLAGLVPHQGLGAIQHLLLHDAVIGKAIRSVYPHDHKWLLGILPSALEPLVALRNPAAHSRALVCDAVLAQREAVLGIGCEGLIVQLARAKSRAQV